MPDPRMLTQVQAIAEFLLSRDEVDGEQNWLAAQQALQSWFAPPVWVLSKSENTYGPGAHRNLFRQEIPRDFRDWLTRAGVDEDSYAIGVGSIQYSSAQMHLSSVMPESRSNRGWRVRAIGFPALDLIGVGLSSNYQGTQNQNAMGAASARIRETALSLLEERTKLLLQALPSAKSSDWDERGLMASPITAIGPVDISGYDSGRGARLRMIRNTTVKKEIATFFALRGYTREEFHDNGAQALSDLHEIATELGQGKS